MSTQRTIKFRAWDGEAMYDATQYPDWTLDNFVNAPIMNPLYRPDPERYKLMQYTGLKDKEGREIYEGDVVATHYSGGDRIGQVYNKMAVKWGVFDIGCNGREYSFTIVGPYVEDEYLYGQMIDGEVTVIGNIYENPELIEA